MVEDSAGEEGSSLNIEPENKNLDSLASSPINVAMLKKYALNYDPSELAFLVNGFTFGFPLQYSGPRGGRDSKNLRSAMAHQTILAEKINTEIEAGRVAGPFKEKPFENLTVSPLGLVPKKCVDPSVPEAKRFRMIHHLSYPEGGSINDFIDPKLASVQYTSFDEAVSMIQKLDRNCQLFKMDLKNAFRLIPVRKEDFALLGFKFNEKYYFDKALPFGAAISCSTFEKFARLLEFCIKEKMESGNLIHYLDDFLGGDKSKISCAQSMSIFQTIMSAINVPIADEKTVGPTEVLVFLGLELDSINMTVKIPLEKILTTLEKIQQMLAKQKTTLKEMQSLIGTLNFCCRAIPMGRPFCRRLINATCGLTKPYHHTRVNNGIRKDLQMWQCFFQNHNGISVFHDRFWVSSEDLELFTDSAGGAHLGFGIYFKGHWCNAKWPKKWHIMGITKDITVLELFPIVVTLFIWAEDFKNKKIKFHCDNRAVVDIINKLSSKSELVMCLIRVLTLKCLKLNVVLKACHVQGKQNSICDALSRFQLDRFHQLAPNADPAPRKVPDHLWTVFSTELEDFFRLE